MVLRFFIGLYKVLFRVIKNLFDFIVLFEDIIVGGNVKDIIVWNDELFIVFDRVKKVLFIYKVIILFRFSD